MAKFCPNCGTELKENSKFCHNCGVNTESFPAAITPSAVHAEIFSVCPECSGRVNKLTHYCDSCGKYFDKDTEETEIDKSHNKKNTKKGTIKLVIFILMACFVLTGIIGAVIGKHKRDIEREAEYEAELEYETKLQYSVLNIYFTKYNVRTDPRYRRTLGGMLSDLSYDVDYDIIWLYNFIPEVNDLKLIGVNSNPDQNDYVCISFPGHKYQYGEQRYIFIVNKETKEASPAAIVYYQKNGNIKYSCDIEYVMSNLYNDVKNNAVYN